MSVVFTLRSGLGCFVRCVTGLLLGYNNFSSPPITFSVHFAGRRLIYRLMEPPPPHPAHPHLPSPPPRGRRPAQHAAVATASCFHSEVRNAGTSLLRRGGRRWNGPQRWEVKERGGGQWGRGRGGSGGGRGAGFRPRPSNSSRPQIHTLAPGVFTDRSHRKLRKKLVFFIYDAFKWPPYFSASSGSRDAAGAPFFIKGQGVNKPGDLGQS